MNKSEPPGSKPLSDELTLNQPDSEEEHPPKTDDAVSQNAVSQYKMGQSAMLACLLEASAPKVGNVHRSADFADTTFYDFIMSAVAIEKIFDRADDYSLGDLILESVRATQACVGTNTNLGMILLLAPLAKCGDGLTRDSVASALSATDLQDREKLYQAIALAKPGGMGTVAKADIHRPNSGHNSQSLLEVMSLAAERDSIALQYSNGYQEFFEIVVPAVRSSVEEISALPDAIIAAHLRIMAKIPDTLIARKCGAKTAKQSSVWAAKILGENKIGTPEYYSALNEFDFWLRGDGNRRNPGTSADFVAAGIFACLRTGVLTSGSIRMGLAAARSTFPMQKER